MIVDGSLSGVEVTEQGLWETLSLQEDVTETVPVLETTELRHRKKPLLRNVAALVLLLTAFCVVVTLVAHKALASKAKSAKEYPKIKDEEAQQKLHELVDFMDSCRLPPENRPTMKTVSFIHAGVQVTVELVEMRHEDNWPLQEVVSSARDEVQSTVEIIVDFLNKRDKTNRNRWEAFRINAGDGGPNRGLLHFVINASK